MRSTVAVALLVSGCASYGVSDRAFLSGTSKRARTPRARLRST